MMPMQLQYPLDISHLVMLTVASSEGIASQRVDVAAVSIQEYSVPRSSPYFSWCVSRGHNVG